MCIFWKIYDCQRFIIGKGVFCNEQIIHDFNLGVVLAKTSDLIFFQHQQHRAEHHDEDEDGMEYLFVLVK